MSLNVLLISERSTDRTFVKKVSTRLSAAFAQSPQTPAVENWLVENPNSLVFWDIDSSSEEKIRELKEMGQRLGRSIPPERVFALCDEPLSSASPLAESQFFGHHVLRRFDAPASEVYAKLGEACLSPNIGVLAQTLDRGGTKQTLPIRKLEQKTVAVEAMHQTLKKRGLNARLCANVAQAADELLLNALYDAPRDAAGNAYRKDPSKPSLEFFELKGKEEVTLTFTTHPDFFTICVRDRFGTLDRGIVQAVLRRDYQKTEYSGRGAGGGLGIYDMYKGGLSLFFAVRPGEETQAWIIVPLAESYKKFRGAFHFFGFKRVSAKP